MNTTLKARSADKRVIFLAAASIVSFALPFGVVELVDRFDLGGDQAGDAMLSGLIGLPMSVGGLVLGGAALVITVRRWRDLSSLTRLFGVLPAIGYLITIVVMLLLFGL